MSAESLQAIAGAFEPGQVIPGMNQLAPEAWRFSAIAGLMTWALAPAYAAVVAIGSFAFGAWLGRQTQREREIAKVEEQIRNHILQSLAKPTWDFVQAIVAGYGRLDRYVGDRWSVFERDAQKQLEAAGRLPTTEDARKLVVLEADLARTRQALEAIAEEIRWTPTG